MAEELNPYAFNFAMVNSCNKQSNAFESSVNGTPNDFPLSTDVFLFSYIANRKFCALKSLQKPHWYFHSNGSIKFVIYLLIIFSKIFEIISKILIGRKFSIDLLKTFFKNSRDIVIF